MPLPDNISRKLAGKGGKSTASIVEDLKQQHAKELARTNDDHSRTVALLESEMDEYRTEIETLKALSDEHSDMLTPLPSPSKSLKFVKNTQNRKAKKIMGGGKNAAKTVAEIKMQHKKDLTRAADIYRRKLQSLKAEVDQYKKETEALKASGNVHNTKKGVAVSQIDEKENVANLKAGVPLARTRSTISSKELRSTDQALDAATATSKQNVAQNKKIDTTTLRSRPGEAVLSKAAYIGTIDATLRDQYQRLFSEEYQFEKDPVYEEAIELGKTDMDDKTATKNDDEIDAYCEDLVDFMRDVNIKYLGVH